MANWQRKLSLADIWPKVDKGEMTIQQLAAEIAKRLKAITPLHDEHVVSEERDEIVEEFENFAEDPTGDKDEFDDIMNGLYDWGDTPLENTTWPPKKVCWIATQF